MERWAWAQAEPGSGSKEQNEEPSNCASRKDTRLTTELAFQITGEKKYSANFVGMSDNLVKKMKFKFSLATYTNIILDELKT